MQGQIEDKIDAEYADKVDLMTHAEENFKELIRACINCLVVSLCARNDEIYAQSMLKLKWSDFESVGTLDTSSYMNDIKATMKARVAAIKSAVQPVYFNLVMNKLASALPSNYLINVYRIKGKVNSEASQQFLFDI